MVHMGDGENTGPMGTVRTAMQASGDPRAAKTRQVILDAVEKLASERQMSPTVSDIVRVAGISRSSFYAHFASLDELAVAHLREAFLDIGVAGAEQRREDLIVGAQAARIGFLKLVAHLVDNYGFYESVLSLPLSRRSYDDTVQAYAMQLLESIIGLAPVPLGVNPQVVATYVAGGSLTLIGAWMRGDIDISDDDLVDQLVGLLPSWINEPHHVAH